jgi:hypothetical protein
VGTLKPVSKKVEIVIQPMEGTDICATNLGTPSKDSFRVVEFKNFGRVWKCFRPFYLFGGKFLIG